MVLCHLPKGPTAHFKVSNVRLRKEMKASYKMTRLNAKSPDNIVQMALVLKKMFCLFFLRYLRCAATSEVLEFSLCRDEEKIQLSTIQRWFLTTSPLVWATASAECLLLFSHKTRSFWVDRSPPSTTRETLSFSDSTGVLKPTTPHTGVMFEPFQSRSAYFILLIKSFLGLFPGTFSKMRKKLESRSWDLVSRLSCAHFRKAPLTRNLESMSGSWRSVEGHLFHFIESEHPLFIQSIIYCRV